MAHEFFKVSVYRYAPETFSASYCYAKDAKQAKEAKFVPVPLDYRGQRSFDDLKRIVRKQAKKKTYYTYGFLDADDAKRFYCVTQYLFTRETSLENRLITFRQIKAQFDMRNWEIEASRTATLGQNFSVESVERNVRKVNQNKFCIVKVSVA